MPFFLLSVDLLQVFEPAGTCGKRRSQPGIAGGAVLERPSTKIRQQNL